MDGTPLVGLKMAENGDYVFPFDVSVAALKCLRLFVYGVRMGNVATTYAAELVQVASCIRASSLTAYVECLVTGMLAVHGIESSVAKRLSELSPTFFEKYIDQLW